MWEVQFSPLASRWACLPLPSAVLGGIGNLVGAMLGGVLIGIIEALASLIPDSTANHGFGLPHGGAAWHGARHFCRAHFNFDIPALWPAWSADA